MINLFDEILALTDAQTGFVLAFLVQCIQENGQATADNVLLAIENAQAQA